MRAVKRVERRVVESQKLLKRMAREPGKVLEALEPLQRDEVVDELRVLAKRAATVRKGSELLTLADDVVRLVVDRPALLARFPVTVWRTGTQGDIDIMFSESQVMGRAAQIDNSVVQLGTAIEEEMQKLPKQRRDDARR